MSASWLRLWHDMPNDPKWRTISKVSKQPITAVLSVYIHLLVIASNATERGRTLGMCEEDIASALDLECEQVEAILNAMQGRVIEGDMLSGWSKRQVEREDGSAERSRLWRALKKQEDKDKSNANEPNRTQTNANERKRTPDTDTDTDTDKSKPKSRGATATRLPADWQPTDADREFCASERADLVCAEVIARFRDYWIAQPGAKGRKADWNATWRNWVRNEKSPTVRAPPNNIRSSVEERNSLIAKSWMPPEMRRLPHDTG